MADPVARHNVTVSGAGERPILFAHGYGCDQHMWRLVAPAFAPDHRVVLFDHVGHGGADPSGFDPARHGRLEGYAEDVLEICHALDLRRGVLVGHSVSAMIAALAAIAEPERFARLVMIAPSPCYLNDAEYRGGFERGDIESLLDLLDSNPMGFANAMAPTIMGNPDRPQLAEELAGSFCRAHPEVARHFARATFLSDTREELAQVRTRALVMQCSDDAIAPEAVGRYVHRRLPDSAFVMMRATGHCPHLSAPEETVAAIRAFLAEPGPPAAR